MHPTEGVHVFKSVKAFDEVPDDRWWLSKLMEWVAYVVGRYLLCCICRKIEYVPPPYRVLDWRWWLW